MRNSAKKRIKKTPKNKFESGNKTLTFHYSSLMGYISEVMKLIHACIHVCMHTHIETHRSEMSKTATNTNNLQWRTGDLTVTDRLNSCNLTTFRLNRQVSLFTTAQLLCLWGHSVLPWTSSACSLPKTLSGLHPSPWNSSSSSCSPAVPARDAHRAAPSLRPRERSSRA